jgi:hypothetical protein
MPARFVEKRIISAVEELNPIERDQLRAAGKLYDGVDRPAEDRLAGGVVEGDGSLFDTELWKCVDGDRHLYDAWFYMGDSGTFFRAGTTEVIAEVIQCGLECEDPELRGQLGPAMVAARLLPASDGSYAEFAAMLEQQEGGAGGGRAGRGGRGAPKAVVGKTSGAKREGTKQAGAKKAAAKKSPVRKAAKQALGKQSLLKKAPLKAAGTKAATMKPATKKPATKKAAPKKAAPKKAAPKKAAPKKAAPKKTAKRR